MDLTGEQSQGKAGRLSIEFELEQNDEPDGPELNDRGEELAAPIRSEQAAPKVGIDFRVEVIDKDIDQKKGRHQHIDPCVQFEIGIGQISELFKDRQADDQGEKGL